MPGPTLRSIAATWTTPFSTELWEKLEAAQSSASEKRDFLAFGPTLPDDRDERTANAIVHRHGDDDELHWVLNVEPAPSGDPPSKIKDWNEKLGGRKGLSSLLGTSFVRGVPAIGSLRARYWVSEAEHRCRVIPSAVEKGGDHDAALRIGAAQLEQVGYRFEAGTSGIEEIAIVYFHEQAQYSLTIVAKGPLKLGADRWLLFADDILDIALSTFFLPAGEAT